MVIIHIANINSDIVGGVQFAVPKMVKAQSEYADVGFVNTNGDTFDGINMLPYDSKLDLDKFPTPFNRPDIVVFHEIYRKEYIQAYRLLCKLRIPYVIIPHGSLSRKAQCKKWLKKKMANILLFKDFIKKAGAVQYLSDSEKSMTAFPKISSFVSASGISVPNDKKVGFFNSGIKFVYIGRLEIHIKGLDLLLKAVKKNEALMREKNAKVEIFGPDYDDSHRRITELIDELNIADLVFLGKEKMGEEKKRILLSSDCFIQTSRTEGLPLGPLEAMGYGLPCIVTEGVGLGNLIDLFGAGRKCNTSSDGIADAMKWFINNCDKTELMSAAAVELVKENFDVNVIAEKTVSAYKRYSQKNMTKGCSDVFV